MKESIKKLISKGVALVETNAIADVIVTGLVGCVIGTLAILTINAVMDVVIDLTEANEEQLTLIEDGKKLCKNSKED